MNEKAYKTYKYSCFMVSCRLADLPKIVLLTLSISVIPAFTRSNCSSPGAKSAKVGLLTIVDPIEAAYALSPK